MIKSFLTNTYQLLILLNLLTPTTNIVLQLIPTLSLSNQLFSNTINNYKTNPRLHYISFHLNKFRYLLLTKKMFEKTIFPKVIIQ